MSKFQYEGRRVADSKPTVRSLNDPLGDPFSGLSGAWDSLSKAKTALRRAEFRVSETEKPSAAAYLEREDILSSEKRSVVNVDRVPSYSVSSHEWSHVRAPVDNHGRTAYMKEKMRKVSRIENKYSEDKDESIPDYNVARNRSPLREPNHFEPPSHSQSKSSRLMSAHGPSDYPDTSCENTRDTTHSTAIRDTEIRFLNETNYGQIHKKSVLGAPGTRYMHVDVQVPGRQHAHADGKVYTAGSRMSSGPTASNTTFSVDGSDQYDADNPRRLKKKLKDANKRSGGLEKVKELIRKQRQFVASRDETDSDSQRSGQGSSQAEVGRVITERMHHDMDEPIKTKSHFLHNLEDDASQPVRKVAIGPPAPSYKGFNETEKRKYPVDPLPRKSSEIVRKVVCKTTAGEKYADPEETSHKPVSRVAAGQSAKKATIPRTVAVPKKPSKYDRKDIITTSSWRKGQKLIEEQLGKSKLPATSDSPPTRDKEKPAQTDQNDGSFLEEDEVLSQEEKFDRHLPTAAKAILADLNSDEERLIEKEKRERKPALPPEAARKRRSKQPKDVMSHDVKMMKVRHYDSSEVRQYIVKQRADRRKKHQEEIDAKRKLEEEKQKKLNELAKKQKVAARSREHSRENEINRVRSKSVDRKSALMDGDNHGLMGSGESDKENRVVGHDSEVTGHDSEASSVDTLTEDDIHSTASSDSAHSKKPASSATTAVSRFSQSSERPTEGVTVQDIINKYTQETGLTTDDVVTKYASQAQAIRSNFTRRDENTAKPRPAPSDPVPQHRPASTVPAPQHRPLTAPSGEKGRSKQARIQALRNTAASLSSRIAMETKQFTENTGDRWAYPALYESDDFVSRYQKMEGLDYRVLDTDLPGARSYGKYREKPSASAAATTIQAAFRGHSVRRDLAWRLPGHKYIAPRQRVDDDSDDTADLLTDGSVTDDSLPSTKVKLRGIGELYSKTRTIAARSQKPAKPYTSWDEQDKPDPHNVFSAYSRKQSRGSKEGIEKANDISMDDISSASSTPPSSREDHIRQRSETASQRSDDKSGKSGKMTGKLEGKSSEVTNGLSEVCGTSAVSYKDDFTSVSQPTSTQPRSRSQATIRTESVKGLTEGSQSSQRRLYSRGSVDSSQDDTLDGTLTPSLPVSDREDSEDVKMDVEENENKSLSLVLSQREPKPSSSSSDETSYDVQADELNRQRGGVYIQQGSYRAPALTPSVLESRMMMELGRYESVEESLRQLTDVERTRAVSLAQQETVSLAQILKSQQQSNSREMQQLQLKVQQDSLESGRELEDARRRAAEAAQNAAATIAKVRSESGATLQESTRKLLETQAEAAKATADAAKQLAEAKAAAFNLPPITVNFPDAGQLLGETAQMAAGAAVTAAMKQYEPYVGPYGAFRRGTQEDRSVQYSHRDSPSSRGPPTADVSYRTTDVSYGSETFDESYTAASPTLSPHTADKSGKHDKSVTSDIRTESDLSVEGGTASVVTGSVVTASDVSKSRDSSHSSSIHTESDVRPRAPSPLSKSASIAEDIQSEKDYSLDFDGSLTEDELEKSLRDVLPTVPQRKMLKTEGSREDLAASFSSDDFSQGSGPPSRRLSFESDSFTRFTVDMVRQYMQEEEIRSQHQNTLLKLREMALKEKTKAELAWIEQQKLRLRSKGADDQYPNLKKRQRALIRRLQQHQAEIKRIKEANKAASKDRQLLLLQSQEIAQFRQSAKQLLQKVQVESREKASQWLRDHYRASKLALSDTSLSSSQVRLKLKHGSASKPHDLDLEKAGAAALSSEDDISTHLDDDHSLLSPRKDALDSVTDSHHYDRARPQSPSEAHIQSKLRKLDDKYLTIREQRLQHHKHKPDKTDAPSHQRDDGELRRDKTQTSRDRKKEELPALTPRTPRTEYSDTTIHTDIPTDSVINTEKPDTARTIKSYSTITEEIASETATSRGHSHDISDKRSNDSSDETVVNSSVNESYTQDTFETTEATKQSAAVTRTSGHGTTADKPPASPDSRLSRLAREKGLNLKPPRSPKTPQNGVTRRGESGSESEDSFSMTISETPSDQSDYEVRIKALNEELTRRKLEAERLKKEHKRRKKDRMKEQEASLKKQIEAYDTYINQVRSELSWDGEVDSPISPVRPQIKQPMATESKRLKKSPNSAETKLDIRSPPSELKAKSEKESQKPSPDDSIPPSVITNLPDVPKPSTPDVVSERTSSPKQVRTLESQELDERSEVSVGEECITGFSESEQQSHDLKLKLDISANDEKPPASLKTETKVPESARTLSEIHEEYSLPISARSETSESVSPRRDVTTPRSPGVPSSARSRSEVTETDDYDESYSSVSRQDGRDKSYTEDFSESKSEMTSSVSSYTHTSTSRSFSTQQDKSRLSESRAETKQKTSSIQESIETEEDISEHFEEDELPEDDVPQALTFDLKSDVPVTSTLREPPAMTEDLLDNFTVGDRVIVNDSQTGTLRYKGPMVDAAGFWAGVELDSGEGESDGIKDSIKYFECEATRGVFVPHQNIQKLVADQLGTPPLPVAPPPTQQPVSADGDDILDLLSAGSEGKAVTSREGSVTDDVDSELERVISSAAAAVEEFSEDDRRTVTPEPHTAETRADEDEEAEGILEEQPPEELLNLDLSQPRSADDVHRPLAKTDRKMKKAADTAENTVQNLLNEAISDMISIRNKKREGSPEPEKPKSPTSDKQDILSRFLKKDYGRDDKGSDVLRGLDLEIPPAKLDLDREANRAAALDFSSATPTVIKQDDLDKLYEELGSLTAGGEEDGWMDDDFGISSKNKHKPPPPYQEKVDKDGFAKADVEVNKVVEEASYWVPHLDDQISPLVCDAVDFFWEQRRYGEPWENAEPPESFYSLEDSVTDIEGKSRRVFKRLVFDLVGDVLREMYHDDDDDDDGTYGPWSVFKITRGHCSRDKRRLPTSVQALKPITIQKVKTLLWSGTVPQQKEASVVSRGKKLKWGSRKKKDNVDFVLVDELREEEAGWVNYDNDELAVKIQLADTIFDGLLSETTQVLNDIQKSRALKT